MFETPAWRFTSRFAGQSEALCSHTSHSLYLANRCFHLPLWFDPVEKQITLVCVCVCMCVYKNNRERERESSDNGTRDWVERVRSGRERKEVSLYNCNDSQTILRRILALCPHFLNSTLYRNSSALILTFVCCVCADVHICVCSIAGHIVSLSGEDLFHFLSVVVCWRCAWILFCSSYSALVRARVR